MDRAEFLKKTAAGAAGLALATSAPAAKRRTAVAQERGPNVLLIMTDDQPYYTVRRMGNLLALVGGMGATFERAYLTTPQCAPSRATYLTGMLAHNHGLLENTNAARRFRELGLNARGLGKRFQSAGYATGYFGKFMNNYGADGIRRWVPAGWDRWFAFADNPPGPSYKINDNGTMRRYERPDARLIPERAQDFVGRHAGAPWFCFLSLSGPHQPYTPTRKHAHDHDGMGPEKRGAYDEKDVSDKPRNVRDEPRITEETEGKIRSLTEGKYEELADIDDYAVRDTIRVLRDTGQLERTYIFFVTDNGFLLGQHRLLEKRRPYDESARTPLLVRGPGIPAGSKRREIAANIDLPATFAEIAGFDPAGYDGRSLLTLLKGEDAPWRSALKIEWHGKDEKFGDEPGYDGLVTQDNRMYAEYDTGEREYYDMVSDPDQAENLSGRRPEEEAALAARLAGMRGKAGDAYRTAESVS
jgi:arylsulfatase A-like enzyme